MTNIIINVCIILFFVLISSGLHFYLLLEFLQLNRIIEKKRLKFILISILMGLFYLLFDEILLKSYGVDLYNFTHFISPLIIFIIFYRGQCVFNSFFIGSNIFVFEYIISTNISTIIMGTMPKIWNISGVTNHRIYYLFSFGIENLFLFLLLVLTVKLYKLEVFETKSRLLWTNNIIIALMGSIIGILAVRMYENYSEAPILWIIIGIASLASLIFNNSLNNSIITHKILLDEIHNKNLHIEKINEELKETHERLIQKERFSSLGQIAGGMAHNLRTPIMAISGNIDTVKHFVNEYEVSIGDTDVTNKDHFEIAKDMKEWLQKNDALLEYMNKIITYVMNQTINVDDSSGDILNINNLTDKISILMDYELKSNNCKLNIVNKVKNQIPIKGKANILIQALNNLISNAIHSYQGNEGIIELIFESDNNYVKISVNDRGCGIPAEIQNQLFKKMITTKGKNGTGLGLYISYSAIKGYFSGDITFESNEGSGSKFIISIPI